MGRDETTKDLTLEMTTADVCARFGVTRECVRQWVKAKKLKPARKAIGRIKAFMFEPAEVLRWELERQSVTQ